ncbi:putative hydrolase protein [Emericellopsis atlantica]|uniref:Hydrolase protein n=1 Tax=Emericellopsis atlantica TaxID=2614577 RepID=A0A9P7ZED3_9HYPO|nr:putative hydrolase protein [Emericellopsis atlantica]KAG9250010.1 putative hydrolase protein [Emericellopsis atlantica]
MCSAANPSEAAAYPPSKTALVLLDYHNLLFTRIQGDTRSKLTSSVKALSKAARDNGVPIIHGLIGFKGLPAETSKLRARLEEGIQSMVEKEPQLAEEFGEFASGGDSDNEITVYRTGTVSALRSEGIHEFLKSKGVQSLIIGGISTTGTVLSTAREATDSGYVVTVARDACWDPIEESHRVLLEHVLPMTAWVAGHDEAMKLLAGS